MIKAIIFDYDGVLIFLPETHYQTLNRAIEEVAGSQYLINREEQNKTYNGLSTKVKLNLLIQNKNLPANHIQQISDLKQKYTIEAINSDIKENIKLRQDLIKLRNDGFQLYVASNAKYDTVVLGLKKLGIYDLFNHIFGNESVIGRQKPAPDIYLKCFLHAGLDPKECLIVEDSVHGRSAAMRSGAHLCTVDNPDDTTYSHIKKSINKANKTSSTTIKWPDSKLTVVLPMGGRGSRFSCNPKYKLPKPLIDVGGKPMIQMVVENMNVDAEFIFIVQKSHYEQYNLQTILSLIAPGCKIIQVDGVTEGAACSVLLAKEHINNDDHLFIINSDQYLSWDSSDFFNKMLTSNADGGIITFKKENDTKWSYIRLNEEGYIAEVKEKQPISNLASVGGYWFKKGSDFVKSAEEMIKCNDRFNGEFYNAPVYNYLIKNGGKVISYEIPTENFYGVGVPEDLELFLNKKVI